MSASVISSIVAGNNNQIDKYNENIFYTAVQYIYIDT